MLEHCRQYNIPDKHTYTHIRTHLVSMQIHTPSSPGLAKPEVACSAICAPALPSACSKRGVLAEGRA